MEIYRRPTRVRAWMEGYYASQIEHRKGLSDIPLLNLDDRYLAELARRADRETKHLKDVRPPFKRRA